MRNDENYLVPSNLDKDELLTNDTKLYNIGYLFIKLIYQELGIDKFLKDKNSLYNFNYDLNKIFSLLVFSRILYPGSKKDTFDNRDRFFEPYNNFQLKDVYRSLGYRSSIME